MSLTLFRSTAFGPSELLPGEMRTRRHPGWIMVAVAGWVGLASNPALWGALACACTQDIPRALGHSVGIAALAGLVLSVFAWRRVLKPAAALMLLMSAALAASLWMQGRALDTSMLQSPQSLLPTAALWLDWRFGAIAAALAVIPLTWLRQQQPRRLTPAHQRSLAAYGALLSTALLALAATLF